MKEQLQNYFTDLEDPRSTRNQKYPFLSLIGTSFLASLSGIDSFNGMEDFAQMHAVELRQHFDFPKRMPSHDTFQRLWDSICPKQFKNCFLDFVGSLEKVASHLISLDGKTIRNSGKEKPLHIVSAWCQNNQVVFGQEKVDFKSNEITAIPKLLSVLDLKNKMITIDAIGAQRDICQQIVDAEGEYLISLKGNQGSLHRDVKLFFADQLHTKMTHEHNDKGHGRIEQRTASIIHDIEWFQKQHNWPGLKAVGMIKSTILKKGKETVQTRYYISSRALSAEALNKTARQHWGIENKLHWSLDVIYNEDKSCIRNDNSAENIGIMRKWGLAVLKQTKQKKSQSVKSLMRRNSMSFAHLISSVKKILHA